MFSTWRLHTRCVSPQLQFHLTKQLSRAYFSVVDPRGSTLSQRSVCRLRRLESASVDPIRASKYPRAVRPVPIKIIAVSKGSSTGASGSAGEWADKLRRYTEVKECQVRTNPKRASDPDVIRAGEAERVLKLLAPQDEVIVLDERGRNIDSYALADLLAQAGDNGVSSLAFCIGGPYGHADAVRQRATHTICLSSLVLNHQVALIVLLEALFRSYTILRGEPYHH